MLPIQRRNVIQHFFIQGILTFQVIYRFFKIDRIPNTDSIYNDIQGTGPLLNGIFLFVGVKSIQLFYDSTLNYIAGLISS